MSATITAIPVEDVLKRAGLSTDLGGYTKAQLDRAASAADSEAAGGKLATYIMKGSKVNDGNGPGAPRKKVSGKVREALEAAEKAFGQKAPSTPLTVGQQAGVLKVKGKLGEQLDAISAAQLAKVAKGEKPEGETKEALGALRQKIAPNGGCSAQKVAAMVLGAREVSA
jgi:hypothetical protein